MARVLVVASVFSPVDVLADETAQGQGEGVDLLNAESISTCTPPLAEAVGWKLVEGRLTGMAGGMPLAWHRPIENFELQMTWTVSDAGAMSVRFLSGEARPVELRLSEDPGVTIKLPQEARSLKMPEDNRGKPHAMRVRISGNDFWLFVDGAKSRRLQIEPVSRYGVELTVDSGQATIESFRVVDLAAMPEVPLE